MSVSRDEQASAEIIPFPVRARSAPPLAPAPASQRLGTALAALSTALGEQQVAIERWRDAMKDLSGSMQKLNASAGGSQPGPQAS